jgi:uridine phosphorylase
MIEHWCDPLDNSRLIISPRGYLLNRGIGASANIAERLVMFETRAAVPHILKMHLPEEYPFRLPAFLSNPPVYGLAGKHRISLVQGGFGAPAAVTTLEVAIALGCKSLFIFGLCGGIGFNLDVGDLVIPTEVVREEGTSFHYAIDTLNALPDAGMLGKLRVYLSDVGETKVHVGKTVSTDAPFRQTLKKELRWQADGILGVDMETSALLTVARYYQIPAVSLLMVSDKHNLEGEVPWTWGGEEMRERRLKAIDLFMEFARNFY